MEWFQNNPRKAKNIILGLNKKYGNFDFNKSSRVLYKKEFKNLLSQFSFTGKRIVIVGGNDGHETKYLSTKPKDIFVVDLAKDALKKVDSKNTYPIYADAQELPFTDSYFDFYLGFRVLFSGHVKLIKCLKEAHRVLVPKGTLIISIPRGYLVDGKIKEGMFNYPKNKIDKLLPSRYLNKSLVALKSLGFQKINHSVLPGEIIISAVKN